MVSGQLSSSFMNHMFTYDEEDIKVIIYWGSLNDPEFGSMCL